MKVTYKFAINQKHMLFFLSYSNEIQEFRITAVESLAEKFPTALEGMKAMDLYCSRVFKSQVPQMVVPIVVIKQIECPLKKVDNDEDYLNYFGFNS